MLLPDIQASKVKSMSQKAVFAHWIRAAAGRPFPSLTTFNPEARMHDPKQLVFWQLERERQPWRYRAIYQGAHVSEAFASNWVGKTLDEVTPELLRYFIIATTNQCASSGRAIYNILRTRDIHGKAIDCERLLLPLGENHVVQQIVASMQLISLEGDFHRTTALDLFKSRTELVLAGKLIVPSANRREP